MSQLALPLRLDDNAVFDTFWPAGNETPVALLRDLAAGSHGPGCWLWGPAASGKTHLLQAVCDRAGNAAMYLPFGLVRAAGPGIVDGLARHRLVCLDGLDLIAGDAAWEEALFALCNQLLDAGGSLIVAASTTPRECGIALPDLQSRFSRLPIFRVAALDDAACIAALQHRARHRGLELPVQTANYLMSRSRRDMASLYSVLDRLDEAALRAKRRLTVPFAREVIGDYD